MIEQLQEQLNRFDRVIPRVKSTCEALKGPDFPNPRYNLSLIPDKAVLDYLGQAQRNAQIGHVINEKTLPLLQNRREEVSQQISTIQAQETQIQLEQGMLSLQKEVDDGYLSSEVLEEMKRRAQIITMNSQTMFQIEESKGVLPEVLKSRLHYKIALDGGREFSTGSRLSGQLLQRLIGSSADCPIESKALLMDMFGEDSIKYQNRLHSLKFKLNQELKKQGLGIKVQQPISAGNRLQGVRGCYFLEADVEIDALPGSQLQLSKTEEDILVSNHEKILELFSVKSNTMQEKILLAIRNGQSLNEIANNIYQEDIASRKISLSEAENRLRANLVAINKKGGDRITITVTAKEGMSAYCVIGFK